MQFPRTIVWSPLLVFPLTFAAVSALLSVVSAHLLGSWDPKWGSPSGQLHFDLTLLPLSTGLQTIGHILGLLLMLRWIDRNSTKSVLSITVLAALMTVLVLELVTLSGQDNANLNALTDPLAFLWAIGVGGLASTVIAAVLVRRTAQLGGVSKA